MHKYVEVALEVLLVVVVIVFGLQTQPHRHSGTSSYENKTKAELGVPISEFSIILIV